MRVKESETVRSFLAKIGFRKRKIYISPTIGHPRNQKNKNELKTLLKRIKMLNWNYEIK